MLASLAYKHSLKEIAKKVNLNYENVRQKKSRGLRKIRKWL
ncbi:MAG: hypothetical protein J7J25_03895 [Candidatus Omnitrophica bacterium]|nr:hypothetical protein [Candidatus Omnitrophota bacterium]